MLNDGLSVESAGINGRRFFPKAISPCLPACCTTLLARYRSPKLRKVRRIAIDEIYQGKRLGYLTIVMDIQSGAVIFVGDGKGSDVLVTVTREKISALESEPQPLRGLEF